MANDYERLGKPHQDRWSIGVGKMNVLARQLLAEGELPESFSTRRNVSSAPKLEAITTPLSAETQRLIEQMRDDGYAVYETSGKTPLAVQQEGMRFWYLNPKFEDVSAAPALLAFKYKPSEFFLRDSHNIVHEKQLELLPGEQAKVDKKYPGEGLVVREGKLPEWTELAFKHWKITGVRITGKDYGFNYTWTDTYESDQPGARRADFGSWDEADGALVFLWYPDYVDPRLRLASLVEIPRK